MFLLAMSCAAPAPAPTLAPRCAQYWGHTDIYGYCLSTLSGGFPRAEDALELCALAGRWQARCRAAWVEARLQPTSGVAAQTLLMVCGADEDCRLDVLDLRADPSLPAQLARCSALAGSNAPHCVGHAVQRWRAGGPGAAELATILALDTPLAAWLGARAPITLQRCGQGSPGVTTRATHPGAGEPEAGGTVVHHRCSRCPPPQWLYLVKASATPLFLQMFCPGTALAIGGTAAGCPGGDNPLESSDECIYLADDHGL